MLTPSMAQGPIFDLVLFGFRNDLARARALAFLQSMPVDESGPMQIKASTAQPQRLFAALNPQRGHDLCVALERLGAQVTLAPAGTASALSLPRRPSPAWSSRSAWRRAATLVVLLAVMAGVHQWRTRMRLLMPPTPPVRASAERLQSIQVQMEAPDEPRAVRLNAQGVADAEAGRFASAVDALREALRLAPDAPVLSRNLQTVLYNWGVSELAVQQFADAGRHLQEAAELGPRAEVLTALGMAYLRQSDNARADDALQRAVALAPGDQTALLALAQVSLNQDQRVRAFDFLQRAKEAGARGSQLDKLLQQLSREVDAEWGFVQLESPHFRASFADDDDRRAVRQVLAGLEDAYDDVGRKFGDYPQQKTDVVLYTRRDFHSVTQSPDWAGAAFDGRIKLPVRGLDTDNPHLARIVRHEYAHSIIARLAGVACPAWLNEGLAVWAEDLADAERMAWAQEQVAGQQLFPLDALSRSFAGLPQDRVQVAYAESYLAVRALVDHYGPNAIPALLQTLARTGSFPDAFASVYADDLHRFEEDLMRQWTG